MAQNMIKEALTKLQGASKGAGKGAGGAGVLLAGAGALIYGINQSLYTVEGGHRAIIFSRIGGIQDRVYAEGLHFRIPWFQYPIIYDIRAKPRRIISPTGSKDLQMVNIGLRVLVRPSASTLPRMYQRLGLDYDERVLPSICNEVLKSVVAQFNASQLITMRQEVSLMIRRDLVERAADFDLILDDVSITDLSFSPQYTAAVESKQVAQQEAQRAAFLVERAIQERQQKIVAAEGEAKSATLLGEAMKENPGYLKLRRIEAARKIAQVIAQSSNKVYLNANNLLLNVKDTDEIDQALGAGMSPSNPGPLPSILSQEVSIDSLLAPSSPVTEVKPEISAIVPDDSWVVIDPFPEADTEALSTIKDTEAVDPLLETAIDENTILTEYIDKVSETVNETLLTVSEILGQEIPALEDVPVVEETSAVELPEITPETLALLTDESDPLLETTVDENAILTEYIDKVSETVNETLLTVSEILGQETPALEDVPIVEETSTAVELPEFTPETLALPAEESASLVSEISVTTEDTNVVEDVPLADVDTQISIPAEEN